VSTLRAILSRALAGPQKLVLSIAFGLAVGYFGGLVKMSAGHDLILDTRHRPVLTDFVAFWTAGHQALKGNAAAIYDVRFEHAAEVATIGHASRESLGWSYPPLFIFVAAGLASLPYAFAFVVWGGGTLTLHAGTVAVVARRSTAFLLACAAPWVLTCLMSGQNGFLTASLIALVLFCLEQRPIVAGLLLGLLSYKPQFGVLFPLALAFGGYWRAFAAAALATVFLNIFAAAIFGVETLSGFLHALGSATQSHLIVDGVGWNKIESLYSFTRALGSSSEWAWTAQTALSAAAATYVAWCWRGRAPLDLKAACLVSAIPLVTPYVLVYDLTVLTVAGAFLFRHRPFDRLEMALLAATVPCVLCVFIVPVPIAFLAILVVAAISAKRIHADRVSVHQGFEAIHGHTLQSG
jgi:hypothetical protein